MIALLAVPRAVPAQGSLLAGHVRDTLGAPLADASVRLTGTLVETRTGGDGSFRLLAPPGEWELEVRRAGYRPATERVRLPLPAEAPSLVIVLRYAPQLLQGLTVEAERRSAMVATITPRTIREVPPLGEPDVFRALVLLPGVAQPNDFKGRIHLAGGASDETGVRLDGHPLQEPFHLLGVLGAFNVAALDRAELHMHRMAPDRGRRERQRRYSEWSVV